MEYVTARRAADLAGLNERTIRRHIASGKIQATRGDDGDYRIPVAALAILRRQAKARASRRGDLAPTVEALNDRIAALELQMREMQRQIARLRSAERDLSAARDVGYMAPPEPLTPSESHPSAFLVEHTADRPVRVNLATPGAGGDTFTDRASAARWLIRHASRLSELSPKTWPGWREVELTPVSVLRLAISLCDTTNHRITWRLHQCGDPSCVCGELLT